MSHTVLTRLDLRGVTDVAAALPAPPADDEPRDAARAILAEVRAGGDAALRAITRRFDGCDLADLRVSPIALVDALATADPAFRAALDHAAGAIREYHEAQSAVPTVDVDARGVRVWERTRPV